LTEIFKEIDDMKNSIVYSALLSLTTTQIGIIAGIVAVVVIAIVVLVIVKSKKSKKAQNKDVAEFAPSKERVEEDEAVPMDFEPKPADEEEGEKIADESEYYSVKEDPNEQPTGVYYYDDDDGPYEAVSADDNIDDAKDVEEQVSITDENGDVSEVLKKVNYDKGIAYVVRYKKSFTARLIQSWDESKTYYAELKNEILSYNGVKSRVTWNYESFSLSGQPIIKIDVRGKTLCVYFSLNPDDYEGSKYKVERTEIKKVEDVPCLYRIKNPTRVSNAKELIAVVCAKFGLTKGQVKDTEYSFPYETTPELVKKELAKEYLVKEQYDEFMTKHEKAKEQEVEREKKIKTRQDRAKVAKMRRDEVSVAEVNELISDEVAAELVEDERTPAEKTATGKKEIVNIDTISANFEKGEIVNLQSLKEKGIIPKSANGVKVLARGILTKPLTIEAQDFSLEAVKMIALTGGTAVKV
jgi:ribosomal protein L15